MLLLAIILIFLLLTIVFICYLVTHDHGEREPSKALWRAFFLGTVGLVIAGVLEYALLPDPQRQVHTMGGLLAVSLGIGLIEELSKCLPLIVLLYRKRFFNEHTDGVIYFALAGMGFGLPENILYTLQFGAGAGFVRLILTPLFHAATTGLIGYMLAKVKLNGLPKYKVGLTIVFVAVIHGLYDFGLYSDVAALQVLAVVITVAMSVNLFVLYHKATLLDQQRGLSVVGNNAFCRTCGHPNPEHKLYCSECGKHA